MSFPLFDNLIEQTTSTDPITQPDIDFFTSQLKARSDIHELVYAIIRCYQLRQGELETYILPYGGRKMKKGIKFDFDKLPNELQHLLLTFLRLHLESERKC